MTTTSTEFLPGFADPVADAQQTFRSILTAMSRPTLPQTLGAVTSGRLTPPAGMSPGMAAVILTLVDDSTPLWLDPSLPDSGEVHSWVRFHTGAPLVDDIAAADFAAASAQDWNCNLAELKLGTDEEPHLSATLILDTTSGDSAPRPAGTSARTVEANGPGINGSADFDSAGLPAGFLDQWEFLGGLFPRGIDVILVDGSTVRALPRTTRLTVTGQEAD